MRCRDSEAHALGKLRARGWASPRTRFVNPRGKTRTRHILHVPEEQSTHTRTAVFASRCALQPLLPLQLLKPWTSSSSVTQA